MDRKSMVILLGLILLFLPSLALADCVDASHVTSYYIQGAERENAVFLTARLKSIIPAPGLRIPASSLVLRHRNDLLLLSIYCELFIFTTKILPDGMGFAFPLRQMPLIRKLIQEGGY